MSVRKSLICSPPRSWFPPFLDLGFHKQDHLYVWAEQSQFKDYEKLDPDKTYVKNVVYQEVIE